MVSRAVKIVAPIPEKVIQDIVLYEIRKPTSPQKTVEKVDLSYFGSFEELKHTTPNQSKLPSAQIELKNLANMTVSEEMATGN